MSIGWTDAVIIVGADSLMTKVEGRIICSDI